MEQRRDEPSDQFPVGMRVLAVDDDPICLKLLETLLRKCQYHVTTTSQAITALKMLRENKNKFELIISDVHMPDMDGFKLLELVGLEMDLPVIMLSANGDTKLVMKGITHGACDYLVKPVRMEELKNIWQHVVRRKNIDSRDRSSNSHDKNSGERNGTASVNSDSDAKLCKKRKDQNLDDDDEQDENEHENDDPCSQKRPRVVWSVELHRKFVAAVNQLGLDKAVPKKILELMNVDKLTRENVASHLQKYRLYLKRISSVANQQANMVAALGGPDSPYLRMNSMNTMNFHGFNGSPQFPNNALRSVPPAGVLGRLNTPAGLGFHGLSPSNMVQLGHSHLSRSSITEPTKFQPTLLPGDQTGTVLQGRPTSLEFDHLQHKKGVIGMELCPTKDNSRVFPVSNSHETFGINSDLPPNLLDHNRCNNSNWPTAVPSQPTPINSTEYTFHDISINIPVQNRLQDSRLDTQCQAGLMSSDNMVQNMSYAAPKQVWDDHKMDLLNHADYLNGSSNAGLHRNMGVGSIAQPRMDSIATEHNQMLENSGLSTAMRLKQGQFMEQGRPFGNYAVNGAGSLEDVVTAMFKQEQDEDIEEWRFAM